MIIKIIILLLILFVLLFAGMIFFNEILIFSYLLVDYNVRSFNHPDEYPRATYGRYIKNFVLEYSYIMAKFLVWPFKWADLTLNVDKKSDWAILLIHGYCRNQSDWLWMRTQIKEHDCPIFCINLRPMLGSIAEIAKNSLPAKINEIKQQTSCKKLLIISHSMGGLVGSYYSEFLDEQKFVKAVVAIGTPYHGTKIAIAGAGENAQQMCPGSKFLATLRESLEKSSTMSYQICSKFDNKVFPWQSALLEHSPPDRQCIFNFEAHLCMLRSRNVAKQLNVWITELIRDKARLA